MKAFTFHAFQEFAATDRVQGEVFGLNDVQPVQGEGFDALAAAPWRA